MRLATSFLACAVAAPLALAGGPVVAADPFYWHPPVTSVEVVEGGPISVRRFTREARAETLPAALRRSMAQLYGPRVAAFARGREADELILLALDEEIFASLERARAVIAQLEPGAVARPFHVAAASEEPLGVLDALREAGFRTLTISDGVNWTHQIELR